MKAVLTLLYLLTAALASASVNELPAEAVAALKSGTKYVLFSLEPPSASGKEPQLNPKMTAEEVAKELERFAAEVRLKPEEGHHGYKILGSSELIEAASRASAVSAITDAVRDFHGGVALCFEPRHSLRVVSAEGTTYDFVACFECSQVAVYRGKERIGLAGMTGLQKPLDDLLTAAKVPLAKPASSK